ncbi:SPOSA6832_01087, partial [Sporobolomyces salmonicolor]
MLTLRSPSPHHSPAFPQPIPLPLGSRPSSSNPGTNGSATSLLAQPASSPAPLSPHSAPGGFFAERHLQQDRLRTSSDESSVKDEQIKLLTAQVNSLSTTVSHLLNNNNTAASGNAAGAQSPHLNGPSSASIGRGMSLPIPSPSLGSFNDGSGQGGIAWGRRTRRGQESADAAGEHGWASEERELEECHFETLSSNSAWDGGVSSPMLGNGGGSAVGSPMLGNPPGSLGSKWEVLGIGNDLFRAIAKYGLGPPTKIQSKSIPCVVRGQDVVAQAPAIQERIQSYVIPALQLIFTHASLAAQQAALEGTQPGPRGIQAIVITATVDQAAQAQRLSVGLGGSLGIRSSLCVGASSASDLQNELQTLLKAPPHILVGTPQKLLDLFSMRALPTHDVRLLVIDECDQLIARNLAEYVLNLARLLPPASSSAPSSSGSPVLPRSPLPGAFDSPAFSTSMARFGSNGGGGGAGAVERQMAIFSCTVPQDVLNFASSLQLREPVRVLVRRDNGGDGASPSMRGLRQYYLYLAVGSAGSKSRAVGAGRREAGTAREWKLEALADLCEDHSFDHAVIFASSLDNVEAIQYKLGNRAIEAYALHQDMGQPARQQILAKFRSSAPSLHQRPGMGSKRVLIVYDVLSRSLSGEVNQVPLVINFDLPRAVEDYIHRIACASTSGYGKNSSMVLNIVTPSDVDMLRGIESFYRCKIQELPPNFATSS